jgi:NAD(P)-dependent dehydrogenase (short-subunit alcohol dehydrogenase family)
MAQAVVDEIRSAGGEAVASGASVSSDDGPVQIVDTAMDTWGRIDGLIHNAAIVLDDHFEDVIDDDLDSIVAVNLRDTFRTVRAVYRAMKDSGGGRIVTLTSASGLSGAFGQAAYATTKMGVVGIIRSVAWEGMRFGIKVNALAGPNHSDADVTGDSGTQRELGITSLAPLTVGSHSRVVSRSRATREARSAGESTQAGTCRAVRPRRHRRRVDAVAHPPWRTCTNDSRASR